MHHIYHAGLCCLTNLAYLKTCLTFLDQLLVGLVSITKFWLIFASCSTKASPPFPPLFMATPFLIGRKKCLKHIINVFAPQCAKNASLFEAFYDRILAETH